MRQTINKGKSSYSPNTTVGGCPFQAGIMDAGFVSHTEGIESHKVRAGSRSFFDHFSQVKLFYNSQSEPEKNHIVDVLSFELGKVQVLPVCERMLHILAHIDKGLATQVAFALGLHIPKFLDTPMNQSIPADGNLEDYQPDIVEPSLLHSTALSMVGRVKDTIQTRQVAILAADCVDSLSLNTIKEAIIAAGGIAEVIAPRQVHRSRK